MSQQSIFKSFEHVELMNPVLEKASSLVEVLQYRSIVQATQLAYIFLEDGEQASGQLTYQALDRDARKIALYCQSILPAGERALLLYPAGLDFCAAFFGCLYAGIVAIPVYPPRRNQKLSRLLSIIKDAQATVVLTTAWVKKDWQQRWQSEPILNQLRWIATDELEANPQGWTPSPVPPGRLAMLQYTSGSIGNPKGVMLSHGNLMHNLSMLQTQLGYTSQTLGLSWLPHYHDMGLIGGVLQAVYGGFLVRFMPPVAFVRKPVRWLQAISRYKITATGGPNFAYDLCVSNIKPEQLTGLDLSSWDLAFTGSEPVRAETLNHFVKTFACCGFRQEALNPGYGLAESTLFVTGSSPAVTPKIRWVNASALTTNQVLDAIPEAKGSCAIVGCGKSSATQALMIVEPSSGKALPDRQVGEIWVQGDSVTLGYWNQGEETRNTFNAFLPDGSGPYLRTGDLGFLIEGELFVTGRLKDAILIRGLNHYPQDIERTVQKCHPALRTDCGAAFLAEINGREQLVVVQEVKRSDMRTVDITEVAACIAPTVSADHGVCLGTLVLIKTGSIPKTSSGKIQRRACRDQFLKKQLKIVGEWNAMLRDRPVMPSTLNRITYPVQPQAMPSTSEDIEGWIKLWLAEHLEISVESICQDTSLIDLGLDSVRAMALTQALEEWLHGSLESTLLWDFPKIHQLSHYLATRIKSKTAEDMVSYKAEFTPIDWAKEAILDPVIVPVSNHDHCLQIPTKIFLTGATGFLGAFLLSELLQQTSAHIYCLVRADDFSLGQARIQKNLSAYQLWQPSFLDRITPILGDLSQPRLGLNPEQFQTLAEQVNSIYHNGALLHYVYPYEHLKSINVGGTESILTLASIGQAKSIHYISSTAVFDCHFDELKQPVVSEADYFEQPEGMYLGYSQSKWVADRMMQNAQDRGFSVYIYRPSFIGGHSQTGVANTQDIIWRMIQGSIQMGYIPALDLDIDLVPVDYVSQNIVALSKDPGQNLIFHLNHPAPLPWKQLVQFIQLLGYPVQMLPVNQWLEKLRFVLKENAGNPLYPLTPFFFHRWSTEKLTILELMQSCQSPQVSCQETRMKLSQIKNTMRCPKLDQQLWKRYFSDLDKQPEHPLEKKAAHPATKPMPLDQNRLDQTVKQLIWMSGTAIYKHWFQLDCRGRENLPTNQGYILAANHTSHLDGPAIIAAQGQHLEQVYSLAAQDYFFNHPIKSWFCRHWLNMIPFNRRGSFVDCLPMCQSVIHQQKSLLLFPEGTRSVTGELQPFKLGLGSLAMQLNAPIIPVHVQGTYQALPKGQTRPQQYPIRVRFGTPLVFPHHLGFDDTRDLHSLYRAIVQDVFLAMQKLQEENQI